MKLHGMRGLDDPLTGVPERTYHGVILPDQRQVIIKEPGLSDALLRDADGATNSFSWGYGGAGPGRLAQALATDAYDNAQYGEVLGIDMKDSLTSTLKMDQPFVISRDRILLEGLIYLNDLVNRSRMPEGQLLRADVKEVIAKAHEVRAQLVALFSKKVLDHLVTSKFGVK